MEQVSSLFQAFLKTFRRVSEVGALVHTPKSVQLFLFVTSLPSFLIMCILNDMICVLPACMSEWYVHALPGKPEEGSDPPGPRDAEGGELLRGCWESNPSL